MQDLSTIGPKRYESKPVTVKSGKKKGGASEGTPGGGGSGGGFGLKRRADTDPDYTIGGVVVKKTKLLVAHYVCTHTHIYYHNSVIEESTTSKIHGYPLEHPFNKVHKYMYLMFRHSIINYLTYNVPLVLVVIQYYHNINTTLS